MVSAALSVIAFMAMAAVVSGPVSATAACNTLHDGTGLARDPEDCTMFYNCQNYDGHHQPCGAGTVYDSRTKICKLPQFVPECSNSPTTPRPTTKEPGYKVCNGKKFYQCGSGSSTRVMGGTSDSELLTKFPWIVAVYHREPGQQPVHICAGAVLQPNLILTAAHCFVDSMAKNKTRAGEFYVAAGKMHKEWPEHQSDGHVQRRKVDKFAKPPQYTGSTSFWEYDIGLLELHTPLECVEPICVDWNATTLTALQAGDEGELARWGNTSLLSHARLPVVSFNNCAKKNSESTVMSKICAGQLDGVNAAPGDSGGPLMFQVHHKWYVRGVVSVGIEQQRVGYSMFTDVQHHRPWLVSKRRRVEGRTRH